MTIRLISLPITVQHNNEVIVGAVKLDTNFIPPGVDWVLSPAFTKDAQGVVALKSFGLIGTESIERVPRKGINRFFVTLLRFFTHDYRCSACDCTMTSWRDGSWVCRCCDLIPNRTCPTIKGLTQGS